MLAGILEPSFFVSTRGRARLVRAYVRLTVEEDVLIFSMLDVRDSIYSCGVRWRRKLDGYVLSHLFD